MADPSPRTVAVWIVQGLRDPAFSSLRNAIEAILNLRLAGRSPEQNADTAEALERQIFSELAAIADDQMGNALEPTFALDGQPGSAYIQAVNIQAPAVLQSLHDLSPTGFESFCASLLSALGAIARQVGRTHDGGVDFIATNLPSSLPGLPALRASYQYVIGQAKRYKEGNLVSLHEVRAFLGAAILKADQLRREEQSLGIFSPATFAFWTTSDFNSAAREFAREAGIWCLSGLAVAQLCTRLGVTVSAEDQSQTIRADARSSATDTDPGQPKTSLEPTRPVPENGDPDAN